METSARSAPPAASTAKTSQGSASSASTTFKLRKRTSCTAQSPRCAMTIGSATRMMASSLSIVAARLVTAAARAVEKLIPPSLLTGCSAAIRRLSYLPTARDVMTQNISMKVLASTAVPSGTNPRSQGSTNSGARRKERLRSSGLRISRASTGSKALSPL